jgi:hypothetical protein
MRTMILTATLVLLAGCGGNIDWADHHGLDPPQVGSTIPAPHGTWIEGPSLGSWAPPKVEHPG